MTMYTASFRTSAGSTALPIGSLYATAAVRPRVFEVGCFNTTAVAVNVGLARLSTTGTQGTGIVESYEDDDTQTSVAQAFQTHSGAPTIGGELRRAALGAAIGSGVIWTFRNGLVIPAATTNGIGIIITTGTGQICDVYFSWEE